jgi:rhamnosyltransferase
MWNIVVPTLNAALTWPKFSHALLSCASPQDVLILDSSSTDGTPDLARIAGFRIYSIPRSEFDHGKTRQLGAELALDAEIIVYLTQDAILADKNSLYQLLSAFTDPQIAAAYGRQLPRANAAPIEAHARIFNYRAESNIRSLQSREQLGLKAVFISNSFAAYRREALMSVGGFPGDIIFGEDTVTAGRLLQAGWKIAYVAEAQVYHSHSYTWTQEFKRYFDIGVLHSRERWLLDEFGRASGEGKRFVLSELKYLWPKHMFVIPSALVRTGLKLVGYRLGRMEQRLSLDWKRRLSMHRGFWK